MTDFYGTATGFKAYWLARGNNQAATDDDDVEVALLIGSEFIDRSYRSQWQGLKVGQREQIRDWPRSGVIDRDGNSVASDVPPVELENATYEAALRQLTTPGIFFKDYTPSKYKSVSITGALSVEYAIGGAWAFQTQTPMIGVILEPLLSCGYGGSSLSGPSTR